MGRATRWGIKQRREKKKMKGVTGREWDVEGGMAVFGQPRAQSLVVRAKCGF